MNTVENIFNKLGINSLELNEGTLNVKSPIDGASIGNIKMHTETEIETMIQMHLRHTMDLL